MYRNKLETFSNIFLKTTQKQPKQSKEKRDKTNNTNDGLGSSSGTVGERNWLGSNFSESFVTQMIEKAVDKVFVEDPKRAETLNREHIIKTALEKLKEETLNSKKMNPSTKVQSSSIGFPSYKPTPIAELNKRHIPVMYAPERPLSVIRKEKGSDDKSQMSISTSSSSSTFAADPSKQWGESRGSKYPLNSSACPAPIQESVTEDNSLDAKDDNSLGEMMDCQIEENSASIDGKIDTSDAFSFSKSQSVTNQLICDDVSTQFGISRSLTEKNELVNELHLGSGNSLLAKNAMDEKTFEQISFVEGSTSNTLVIDPKEEKGSSTISLVSSSKMDLSGISNDKITVPEKKDSHKHGSKSHSSRKVEGSKSSDKHRTKKSSDSALNDKGVQMSSKDKRRSKEREKSEEQNRQKKFKASKSEMEKNISSQPQAPSESLARDDHSKVKRVDKMSDKNDKYSKSNEKVDRNYKHNDHKQRDGKRSQGSKSSSDEVRKKSSSYKHSSNKHTSHHHKDKLKGESSNHTKSVSSSHRKDPVSKPKKRKLDEQSQPPEKRTKVSSKTTAEANYAATDIGIFADSKKESSLTKSSAYNNHRYNDVYKDSEPDDMSSDSVLYSPKITDLDAISISSADSAFAADNCENGWPNVISKSSSRRASKEDWGEPSCQEDSIGRVSDTKWTRAKELIRKTNSSKIRIAHVPNVSNILSAKTRLLSEAQPTSRAHISTKTPIQDDTNPLPRVTKRVAHSAQNEKRSPLIIHSQEIKIKPPIRQFYCKALFNELMKYVDKEEASKMAVNEEYAIALKCNLPDIYKNNCSLRILKIRKCKGDLAVYDDAPKEILKSNSKPEYTYGWTLYKCFSEYLMTDEQLIQHGYPMPLPGQPTCAYTEKSARRYYIQQPDKPFTKQCANCRQFYEIDEDGMPTTSNDCWYHWGKLRKIPGRVQSAEKFTCCDGANDAPPCQSSTYHVWSGRNEDCMPGFVKTKEFPSNQEESSAGIFALDCEMCYTTKGLELSRLTVVNLNEAIVFDQVVSLESPVLDYNTRFSGIDESKVQQATHSFSDVQQWVLDNIYDKSIIVGHSLENDLKVLKVFHKRIVDTSVIFPHKFGFPQKCSLKFLARSILSMAIQESEKGHDSKEDAVTCLRLMIDKIKNDSKIRKPRVIIGFSGKKR